MPHVRHDIVCQNCSASTPLPTPIPQKISQHPELWKEVGDEVVFVCPVCAHGFRYTLRPYCMYEAPSPFDGPDALRHRAVESRCDNSNCESRTRIHTVLPPSMPEGDELKEWIETWTLHGITCLDGDPVTKVRS